MGRGVVPAGVGHVHLAAQFAREDGCGPAHHAAHLWARAHRVLATITSGAGWPFLEQHRRRHGESGPQNTGSQRLQAAAAKGGPRDRALWTPTATASGAGGNTTALVGTPGTVAQALLDHVDIGVTTLLIRGHDPLDDAIDYGRHLTPLVRQELAHRAATATPLTAGSTPRRWPRSPSARGGPTRSRAQAKGAHNRRPAPACCRSRPRRVRSLAVNTGPAPRRHARIGDPVES